MRRKRCACAFGHHHRDAILRRPGAAICIPEPGARDPCGCGWAGWSVVAREILRLGCSNSHALSDLADPFADDLVDLRARLVAFARSLAVEPDEAEDLAQETLLRAVAARDGFRPGTNLRAWLFTILRNLDLNRRRDALRRPVLVGFDGMEERDVAPPIDAQVVARSELAAVLSAMQRLPPTFAAPLQLLVVEELSYAEIASVLEIPIGTVMSRIFRARRRISEWLSEE